MTSRTVDGRRVPAFVAGDPGLELCNTRAAWWTDAPVEYLVDFRALAVWARENGMLTAAEYHRLRTPEVAESRTARAVLRSTIAVRAALHDALVDGDAGALDHLRRAVVTAVRRSQYREAHGTLRLDGGTGPSAVLDRIVLAAHRLLEQHGPVTVGQCAGVGCGWLFLDPARRRRWCVMAVCGNRAKARRFAARQRTEIAT